MGDRGLSTTNTAREADLEHAIAQWELIHPR
jgi:hypothetical protein